MILLTSKNASEQFSAAQDSETTPAADSVPEVSDSQEVSGEEEAVDDSDIPF